VAMFLALVYICLKYLAVWLLPFIIAAVIAAILQRPINWILRHSRINRKVVAPVVTLFMLLLVTTLIVLLGSKLISGAIEFVAILPTWFQQTAPLVIDAFNEALEGLLVRAPVEWESVMREMFTNITMDIQGWLLSFSTRILGWAANLATRLPSLLIGFLITLVATFFMTSDFNKIKQFMKKQIPEKYKAMVSGAWSSFWITFIKMIQSYLLIMCITYVELTIGLALLRVQYPYIIAALIALVDILPVVGTGTILIPWSALALLTGNLWFGFGLLLIYAFITIVRNIIEPRIIGKRIGLYPLVTLMAMFLGLKLLGLFGMFLFPLMLILLKKMQAEGLVAIWKE
jgi:sporulation integral membrane protein YtvI